MRITLVIVTALLMTACAKTERPPIELTPTSFDALTNWRDAHHSEALSAFIKSCDVWDKRSAEKIEGCSKLQMQVGELHTLCKKARLINPTKPSDAQSFFEQHFVPHHVSIGYDNTGLFTGYYIPEMRGSLKRGGAYQTPVYKKPSDLKKGEEYYTRAEINTGKLKNRGLEIAWVDDPVGLFFIEIQGSGVIRLDEGGFLSIGFDAKNNRDYTAIGRVMRERKLLDKDNISLFTIKEWLYNNPDQSQAMMEENESFVFFRPLPDNKIRGAQGAHLTANHSLAVDKGYIPYGMPVYLQTNLPETHLGPGKPFHQLMIAQDTGGAIKGGIRGDIYFGHGELAEALAGNQQEEGSYTLLLPKSVAKRNDISIIEPCSK